MVSVWDTPSACRGVHVVGQRILCGTFTSAWRSKRCLREFQASLVCCSQRGEDVPPNLRPGERRSKEARRRHFYHHMFRGYHQAGSIIVRKCCVSFQAKKRKNCTITAKVMTGWPRRVLTFMFTLDLGIPQCAPFHSAGVRFRCRPDDTLL